MKRYQTRVPSEYQEITYLSNNYNQYINPNLKGSDLANCEIEIVMKNLSTNTTEYNFNGVYESGKVAQLGLVATSATECRTSINFGFASAISVTNLPIDDYHTIYVSDGLQKVDGVTVGTNSFGALSNDNFLLFARTNIDISQISICPKMALKSFTVKKNNQYIRNMIPVKRLSDDTFGLYDLANSVFYTNQGTGVFNAGTNVNNYTWQTKSPPRYETATDAVTNLPVEIFTDGQPVSSYTIKGNTSTSGTPSPQNPITINGVGDKTANLWDGSSVNGYLSANGLFVTPDATTITLIVPVIGGTTYTITKTGTPISGNKFRIAEFTTYPVNGASGTVVYDNDDALTYTLTTANSTTYVACYVNYTSNPVVPNIMFSEGSTALPYEPYGYKISISSNQTALTPVYLTEPLMLISTYADSLASSGTVTRVVKKLVFNGTETFDKNIVDANDYLYWLRVSDSGQTNRTVCSHLLYSATIPTGGTIGTSSRINTHVLYLNFGADIMNAQTSGNTKEGFKEYLAAQYAAGTPVTVYYVLETPTTESVTAPTITTTGGTATIDVDTTIKPSELDLTYHGWHSHEPLKRENGSWS